MTTLSSSSSLLQPHRSNIGHTRRSHSQTYLQQQQQQQQRLQVRYIKGIMIVLLVLISESCTVVNAIAFWNQFMTQSPQSRYYSNHHHRHHHHDDCGSGSSNSNSNSNSKNQNQNHRNVASATCRSLDTKSNTPLHSHSYNQQQHQPQQQECPNGLPHWWKYHLQQPFISFIRSSFLFPQTSTTTTTTTTTCDIPRGGGSSSSSSLLEAATTTTTAAVTSSATTTPFHIPLNVWKLLFQSFLTLINVICWYVPLKIHGHQQRKAAATTSLLVSSSDKTVDPNEIDPTSTSTSTTTPTTTTDNVAMMDIQYQNEQNQFILSIANAFSGGVFLSLAFGHLIPECVHGFIDTTTTNTHNHNLEAVPYLFVLLGYLIIFFVEKVAFSNTHDLLLHPEHHHHHHSHPPPSHSEPISIITTATTTTTPIPTPPTTTHMEQDHHHTPYMNGTPTTTTTPSSTSSSPPPLLSTGRSALILLGALAVHSILEMMALGLADTFRDCALLTISISLHQPAESIALLVAFIKSGLSEAQIIVFLSIFSSMGMIGVLVGMMVNAYAAPIVDSIMLAIVAGTFVYVGATEIIPEEFESSQYKWKKFMALVSGIVTILCITQYTATLGGGH